MLPGVCPCAVRGGIAHIVILDGFAVIGSQQVAPVIVIVTAGISNRICGALGTVEPSPYPLALGFLEGTVEPSPRPLSIELFNRPLK